MADQKFFTKDEVVIHNQLNDCWFIVNGVVFDLTQLFAERQDSINDALRLLLQFAGKDLSQYFMKDGTPQMRLNLRGVMVPVFPPAIEKASVNDQPWYQDPVYKIGKITLQERLIRITNTLTRTTILLAVCEEDTIFEIQQKYLKYNINYMHYIWKKFNKQNKMVGDLVMNQNLTLNGIFYEENEKLGFPGAIWLYYVDTPQPPSKNDSEDEISERDVDSSEKMDTEFFIQRRT